MFYCKTFGFIIHILGHIPVLHQKFGLFYTTLSTFTIEIKIFLPWNSKKSALIGVSHSVSRGSPSSNAARGAASSSNTIQSLCAGRNLLTFIFFSAIQTATPHRSQLLGMVAMVILLCNKVFAIQKIAVVKNHSSVVHKCHQTSENTSWTSQHTFKHICLPSIWQKLLLHCHRFLKRISLRTSSKDRKYKTTVR